MGRRGRRISFRLCHGDANFPVVSRESLGREPCITGVADDCVNLFLNMMWRPAAKFAKDWARFVA
jgi:hypothetical protein